MSLSDVEVVNEVNKVDGTIQAPILNIILKENIHFLNISAISQIFKEYVTLSPSLKPSY